MDITDYDLEVEYAQEMKKKNQAKSM